MNTQTFPPTTTAAESVERAERPLRVCMFVYNNCAHDPRVLKEAGSLTAAGHSVQIVAVLDKLTVPHEERDGFAIVRIARDPPHYRLLRWTRRVRRWFRLTSARARRRGRKARAALKKRIAPARSALTRPVRAVASTTDRRRRARAERAERERAQQAQKLHDQEVATRAAAEARLELSERRASELEAAAEAALAPADDEGRPDPGTGAIRIYRALRWRILKRSSLARRLYYGRRTRRKRQRIRAARRAAAAARAEAERTRVALLEAEQKPADPAQVEAPTTPVDALPTAAETHAAAEPETSAPPPPTLRALLLDGSPWLAPARFVALVVTNFVAAVALIAPGLRWLERQLSHASYRTVMFTHRPLMHIDYYLRAYRLLRDQEFDVFHAHDLNTLPVAVAAARRAKKPFVYDAHELYSEISTLSRTEKRVWRAVEPPLIRRAAHVITVCESIAGELSDRYRVARPTILLNCPTSRGVPASEPPRLRELLGMEDDPRAIVLYQGGFAPNRGLEELVRAGRYIDGGVIVLMGGGRTEADLREMVARERLGDHVVMTPAVPPDQVIPYATGADIGVIPYKGVGLNNYYTTPNKLFDYMAAGLPIAGSRFPEIVRFVEGLGLGVTFDPESPREIAYAINYVLADRRLLDEMRENAIEAGRRFTWEHEQGKLLDIYRALKPAVAPRR